MIDFKTINEISLLYNFHSHTPYCDGHSPMRDYIVEAIKNGFTHYGFTPHSPVPFDSHCNINVEDLDKYTSDFNTIKEEFGDKIKLYKSLEIDYLNDDWSATNKIIENLNLDYKLSSIHFVPCGDFFVDTDGRFDNFKMKMEKYFDNDIEFVVNAFYNQTWKMIDHGGFDIIGHFDKIGQNASYFKPGIESEDWYSKLILKTIEAIKDTGLVAEINTKSFNDHKRFFPNERYFEIVKRYEIPVIFNSDSHYSAKINENRMNAIKTFYNK